MKNLTLLIFGFLLATLTPQLHARTYKYTRIGNTEEVSTKPTGGTALMGGGADMDEAFKWLCDKAQGGDFLVLRARGSDDYNPYVNKLCKLNSVATLVIPNRRVAEDPATAEIIHRAEAVFIAGGDQSRYIKFWLGTPLQDALNAHIAAGKPIGGTSAGLAVLGEFSFAAMIDTTTSPQALKNPYDKHVTLTKDFLHVPHLEHTITDSHFVKRDRQGRTLVFLARMTQDGWSKAPRGVAIDEKSAVLMEPDGKSFVIGTGVAAYFYQVTQPPEVCQRKQPLTIHNISVYRAPTGAHFDLAAWQAQGGTAYSLSVERGVVQSTQPGGALY